MLGFDYERLGVSELDSLDMLLVDTTPASLQLVLDSQTGQVVMQEGDIPNTIIESSEASGYFVRLLAVPPPHGNITVVFDLERRN